MIADSPLDWKMIVLSSGRCAVHDDLGDCELPMRAHHIVTWQALRRHGLSDLRWCVENGLPVCEGAHRRHHSGRARIPRERLPLAAIAFAESVGLGYQIERYYPVVENPGSAIGSTSEVGV